MFGNIGYILLFTQFDELYNYVHYHVFMNYSPTMYPTIPTSHIRISAVIYITSILIQAGIFLFMQFLLVFYFNRAMEAVGNIFNLLFCITKTDQSDIKMERENITAAVTDTFTTDVPSANTTIQVN